MANFRLGVLYACIGPLSVLPDTRDNCIVCTGAPFQWAALFHKDALRFVKGVDNLMFYYPPEKMEAHHLPCKVSCSTCHSPMADEGRKMWMAFPTLFKTDSGELPEAFRASCHIFYKDRRLDIKDGTPKWAELNNKSEQIEEVL